MRELQSQFAGDLEIFKFVSAVLPVPPGWIRRSVNFDLPGGYLRVTTMGNLLLLSTRVWADSACVIARAKRQTSRAPPAAFTPADTGKYEILTYVLSVPSRSGTEREFGICSFDGSKHLTGNRLEPQCSFPDRRTCLALQVDGPRDSNMLVDSFIMIPRTKARALAS